MYSNQLIFTDNETFTGWLGPILHGIGNRPRIVPCPSPPFFFKLKNGTVIRLSNKTFSHEELSELPNPGAASRPVETASWVFAPMAVFNEDSMTGRNTSMMSEEEAIERIVEIERRMNEFLEQQQSPTGEALPALKRFVNWVTSSSLLEGLFAVGGLAVLLLIITWCGGLPTVLAIVIFLLNIVPQILRFFIMLLKFIYASIVGCCALKKTKELVLSSESAFCREEVYEMEPKEEVKQKEEDKIPLRRPPYAPMGFIYPYRGWAKAKAKQV